MTQAAVAKHLDLSLRRLREHYQRGDIDKTADLDTQRVQYIRVLRERAANRAPVGDIDPARERGLKDREIRLGLEQKRLREAGQLISAERVVTQWFSEIRKARDKLRYFAMRISGELVDMRERRPIERLIQHEIDEILEELGNGRGGKPEEITGVHRQARVRDVATDDGGGNASGDSRGASGAKRAQRQSARAERATG